MQVKGSCGSKYCTNNQMKFNVLQKKNDGKMQAVVKLSFSIVILTFLKKNHVDFVKKKMAEFHYQFLVCAINLT